MAENEKPKRIEDAQSVVARLAEQSCPYDKSLILRGDRRLMIYSVLARISAVIKEGVSEAEAGPAACNRILADIDIEEDLHANTEIHRLRLDHDHLGRELKRAQDEVARLRDEYPMEADDGEAV